MYQKSFDWAISNEKFQISLIRCFAILANIPKTFLSQQIIKKLSQLFFWLACTPLHQVNPSCTFHYQTLLHSTSFTMLTSTIIYGYPVDSTSLCKKPWSDSSPPSATNMQQCRSYHLGIISPQHLVIISMADIWGDNE